MQATPLHPKFYKPKYFFGCKLSQTILKSLFHQEYIQLPCDNFGHTCVAVI
jgi:hypothetical protein